MATPCVTAGQDGKPGKTFRIGRLSPLSAEADAPSLAAFRQGLRDLGWVEGQNYTIEARFADGHEDRLSGLATDLVRRGVDLFLTGSQASKLELVVNLKTARALGIKVPQSILVRADRVIER